MKKYLFLILFLFSSYSFSTLPPGSTIASCGPYGQIMYYDDTSYNNNDAINAYQCPAGQYKGSLKEGYATLAVCWKSCSCPAGTSIGSAKTSENLGDLGGRWQAVCVPISSSSSSVSSSADASSVSNICPSGYPKFNGSCAVCFEYNSDGSCAQSSASSSGNSSSFQSSSGNASSAFSSSGNASSASGGGGDNGGGDNGGDNGSGGNGGTGGNGGNGGSGQNSSAASSSQGDCANGYHAVIISTTPYYFECQLNSSAASSSVSSYSSSSSSSSSLLSSSSSSAPTSAFNNCELTFGVGRCTPINPDSPCPSVYSVDGQTFCVSSSGSGSSSGASSGSASSASNTATASNCSAQPSCTGDAIQCAILKQLWTNNCDGKEQFTEPNVDSDNDAVDQDIASLESKKTVTLDTDGKISGIHKEIDLKELGADIDHLSEIGNSPANGVCPAPRVINLHIGTYELSYQPLCDVATSISSLVVFSFTLFSVLLIYRALPN